MSSSPQTVSFEEGDPSRPRIPLEPGARVVVIGGGPAGAFFAIQLLQRAAKLKRSVEVLILERHHQPVSLMLDAGSRPDCWRGCNHCAGGISPAFTDSLRELGLSLPENLVQSRIRRVTIQGHWKNITLEVPEGREMVSVYRGSRPSRRSDSQHNFDGFLLRAAQQVGAVVMGGEVTGVARSENGKPLVSYRQNQLEKQVEAELLVFAAGVNSRPGVRTEDNPMFQAVRQLLPDFEPPGLRRALIFELEWDATQPPWLDEEVHFVEFGSKTLPLEMCSLVPKRGFLTAVLVGRSVDRMAEPDAGRRMARQFLDLPHIRKLIPPWARLRLACTCCPSLVVHTSRHPFGSRVAVVGDMVTSRLYKDGLLSAQRMAAVLAETVLERGVDEASLRGGYAPIVEAFRRDNRFAAVVFLAHRLVFSSSVFSRFLYQAVLTDRKSRPAAHRNLEEILWKIASGDAPYESVLRAMIRPAVLRSIIWGGVVVTLRNWLAEAFFGLDWRGLGGFTTGVALERLEAKRAEFARWLSAFHLPAPAHFEFERMYTIKIRAPREKVFVALGQFGEPDREYLHPRWVRIQRVTGMPNTLGCTVEYRIVLLQFSFRLVLEHLVENQMAVYRVQNGFARGGVLIFELEERRSDTCDLSIYVAFNFPRGQNMFSGPAWWLVRHGFPAFVHDVIWNHSLCRLKDSVEEHHQAGVALLQELDGSTSSLPPS